MITHTHTRYVKREKTLKALPNRQIRCQTNLQELLVEAHAMLTGSNWFRNNPTQHSSQQTCPFHLELFLSQSATKGPSCHIEPTQHPLVCDSHATEVLLEADISSALSDVSVQFVNHLQLKLVIAAHKRRRGRVEMLSMWPLSLHCLCSAVKSQACVAVSGHAYQTKAILPTWK